MTELAPDWGAYIGGLASFAGTLFALVLAARQIRGAGIARGRAAYANLVDSIAVTVELGAAAALAVLYSVRGTLLFSVAVAVVALCGIVLALNSGWAWTRAATSGELHGRELIWAMAQGGGNVLPLAAYLTTVLYALGTLDADAEPWGYAAAASWLTFSGTVQAVAWYARMWDRGSTSAPS